MFRANPVFVYLAERLRYLITCNWWWTVPNVAQLQDRTSSAQFSPTPEPVTKQPRSGDDWSERSLPQASDAPAGTLLSISRVEGRVTSSHGSLDTCKPTDLSIDAQPCLTTIAADVANEIDSAQIVAASSLPVHVVGDTGGAGTARLCGANVGSRSISSAVPAVIVSSPLGAPLSCAPGSPGVQDPLPQLECQKFLNLGDLGPRPMELLKLGTPRVQSCATSIASFRQHNERFGRYPDRSTAEVTNLSEAIATGTDDPVADYLAKGADPNAALDGELPLILAVATGRCSVVRMLLDSDADPNKADEQGNLALVEAVYMMESEIIRLLIGAGADSSLAGGDGKDAAAVAQECGESLEHLMGQC